MHPPVSLVRHPTALVTLLALLVGTAGSCLVAQTSIPAPHDTSARESVPTPSPAPVSLAPVEIHASIAPTAGASVGSGIPARITIVGRDALRGWKPRLVANALATQPGVSLYDDLGSPEKLTLSTRGFVAGPTVGLPPGISVFLDGVRQNEPDAQEVNFDLLPMDNVRRVELLSGTASLLGPNSLGGAVNLLTDRGGGARRGSIEVTAGSFGAASLTGSAAGSFSPSPEGTWDYYASAGAERDGGWRQATSARRTDVFASAGRHSAARGFRVEGFAVHSRAATAGSLPERIFNVSPRTNFTPGDVDNLDAAQLSAQGHAPVAHGDGALTLYVRQSNANRFNVNQAPDPNVRALTSNGTLGATADWRRSLALGTGTLALRAGVDGAANRVRVRIFAEPSVAASPPRSLTTDVTSPSWDAAGYALGDYQTGRVTLSAGARYDYVRVPFRDHVDPTASGTSSYRRLSPRDGVAVALGNGASLYASAGTSFRAPAILELGCADPAATCPLPFALGDDPPLRPVRATTYEIGGHMLAGPAVLSASVYRTGVRDDIFFVASPGSLYSGYFRNLARTRREGVELSANGAADEGRATWYANYAYTRATFQSVAHLFSVRSDTGFAASPFAGPNTVRPGDRLPLVPAHQLKGGATIRVGEQWELGGDARYTGSQWLRGDEGNETRPLAGYTVLDARASYDIRDWQLSLIADNLLDSHAAIFGTFNVDRQSSMLERFLTPMNARTVRLAVRRRL